MNYTIEYLMYINDGIDPSYSYCNVVGRGGLGYKPRGNMIGGMAKRDPKTGKIVTENLVDLSIEGEVGSYDPLESEQIRNVNIEDMILDGATATEDDNRILSEVDDLIEMYNDEFPSLTTDGVKEFHDSLNKLYKMTENDALESYLQNVDAYIDRHEPMNKQEALEKTLEDIKKLDLDNVTLPADRIPENLMDKYTKSQRELDKYNKLFTPDYQKLSVVDNYDDVETRKYLMDMIKGMKEQAKEVKRRTVLIPDDDTKGEMFLKVYGGMTDAQLNSTYNKYEQLFERDTINDIRNQAKKDIATRKNLPTKVKADMTNLLFKGRVIEQGKEHALKQSDQLISNIDSNIMAVTPSLLTLNSSTSTEEERENARETLQELYMAMLGNREKDEVDARNVKLLDKIQKNKHDFRKEIPKILSSSVNVKLPVVDEPESPFFNKQVALETADDPRGRLTENELIQDESLLASIDGDNSKAKFSADETGLNPAFVTFLDSRAGIITTDKDGVNRDYKEKFLEYFPIDVIKRNTIWEIKSWENPKKYSTTKFLKAQPSYWYKVDEGGTEKQVKEYHQYDYEYLVTDSSGVTRTRLLQTILPDDTILGLKNITATITIKKDGTTSYLHEKMLPEKPAGEYYDYYILESGKKNIRYYNVLQNLPEIQSAITTVPDYATKTSGFDIPLNQSKFYKLPRTYERQLMKATPGNKRSFMDVRKTIKK